MITVGSQSARKRKKPVIIDMGNESDGDIVVVDEVRPPSTSYTPQWDPYDPEDNPQTFYSQNEIPKFHTRNLERKINKEKAWSKPLPAVSKLFCIGAVPTKVDELGINPKTVEKLRAILASKGHGRKVVFVTGPSGSGKSTAIDVVAHSLKLEVLKWERDSTLEVVNADGNSYIKEEDEMESFLRFLRRTALLENLKRHKRLELPKGRLYHIEDLPTLAYRDVLEFRRRLFPHLRDTKNLIVFDLTSRDSSWPMSPRRVFTKSFVAELDISELEFYPAASTFIRKCLRRAVDCMGFHNRLAAKDYRAVEKLANGDIRSGLNIIQFSLLSSRENFTIPNVFGAMSNDELFHMLGVLLYAKRENDGNRFLETELSVREELRRPPSERHIDDVLEMSKASADTVMMFLHEHEPNFAGSIATTRKVFDAMSFCDSISTHWETRILAQDLVSQVCARATMFYNYKANRIARGFYKYIRPKWFRLSTQTQSLTCEMNDVMKTSGSADSRFGELDVPYLSLMPSFLNGSQYRLVSYLTRPWTFTWETDRSFWDHRLSALHPAYRMAQLRESIDGDSLLPSSQEVDVEEDEEFIIEDSEDDAESDDSFNDPVMFG